MATGAAVGDRLSLRGAALADFAARAFAVAEAGLATSSTELVCAPGGVPVRLRFADARHAERLLPALRPLELRAPVPAPLEVAVLDERSGLRLPAPPWNPDDYRPRDELRGFGDEQLEVAFNLLSETLSLVDVRAGRGLSWSRDARRLPVWDTGAPLRTALRWMLRGRDRHLMHAAAVGDEHGGVLLAGVSGSGKSTTALACALRSRLRCAGDDFCAVEPGAPPVVHALYGIAKVDDAALRLLPELRGHRAWPERTAEGKTLIDLESARPGALLRSMPLRAIVVPRVAGSTGRPVPAEAAQALLALAPSTLIQLPGSRPADHRALADVARAVPVFTLDLGPDPDAVAAAVSSLLESVA